MTQLLDPSAATLEQLDTTLTWLMCVLIGLALLPVLLRLANRYTPRPSSAPQYRWICLTCRHEGVGPDHDEAAARLADHHDYSHRPATVTGGVLTVSEEPA